MNKDVVFWIGVKSNDPALIKKHGNFEYLDLERAGNIGVKRIMYSSSNIITQQIKTQERIELLGNVGLMYLIN